MIISTTGTAVVSIRASDPDGDDFMFVIQNQLPAPYAYFTVSPNGDVTVGDRQRPDREVRSNYMFCSQHVIVHTFVILIP